MAKSRMTVTEYLDKALADSEKAATEDLVFSHKGILYPFTFCNPETFQVLDSFEVRSDDVILAGYPKNDTNWLDQILNDSTALAGPQSQGRAPPLQRDKVKIWHCIRLLQEKDRMKELPSRRIITTHLPPQVLPKSIFNSKAKILLLVRNPKDTVVSYFHFYNNMPPLPSFNSWNEYFTAFMHGKLCWGSYFDYLIEWNKHIDDENVMMITYEEMKENQPLRAKKIADFFGFTLSEEEIQTVVEKSSFKAVKDKSSQTHGTFGKILFHKVLLREM
ncbi:sulfotransferase 6B1-like [Emydura macquarii macquarii]|uniref:sulfotransferase 6B1-like n=1 Tax=Emydura macquarii macquarii TaxID=1129001 RepID=UPI00352A29F7